MFMAQPKFSGWPRDVIVTGSAILLSLLTVLYAHGFWVV
jgi:hypothetical protein